MGFHICEFCLPGAVTRHHNTSSGDVTLMFDNGHAWEMPDMILHYIADHNWLPPEEFIKDVMERELVAASRLQTKAPATRIAYLSGPFVAGEVPAGFVEKLQRLMRQAEIAGSRIQYRGLK
jgi:hypothetical protein